MLETAYSTEHEEMRVYNLKLAIMRERGVCEYFDLDYADPHPRKVGYIAALLDEAGIGEGKLYKGIFFDDEWKELKLET